MSHECSQSGREAGHESAYKVRAVSCDHRSDGQVVYRALSMAAAPLDRSWERLKRAKVIAVKVNQEWPGPEPPVFEGQRVQLVSDKVVRAVLRLLRENTAARIVCCDASYYVMYSDKRAEDTLSIASALEDFDVEYVDGNTSRPVTVHIEKGGRMFDRYVLMRDAVEADALVSVAKMKNHAFMGITGCLKNQFGLVPGLPHGRPRHYYHHIVRMPYVLADIGAIYNPVLNIVDGLVGQAGEEWGEVRGRVADALVAGDHPVAVDACMTHLMGHDPLSDWPEMPFLVNRNALRVSAEGGYGTVSLDEIDFTSEVERQPEGAFFADRRDACETIVRWRATMCEQALYYRDHIRQFERYAGQYILLQSREVIWHDSQGVINMSRRKLAGNDRDNALFFKYVDPDEGEGERFEVYERTLHRMKELGIS